MYAQSFPPKLKTYTMNGSDSRDCGQRVYHFNRDLNIYKSNTTQIIQYAG